MRDIKFRAFVGGKMDYDIAVDNKGNAMYWDNAHGPLSGSFDMPKWDMFINPAVVMQFTGLKDKNGKDIYEGDICRLDWCIKPDKTGAPGVQEKYKAIIKWAVYKWEIQWSYFSKPLEVYDGKISWYEKYRGCDCRGAFQSLENIEVIGNIYENPELLTGQAENAREAAQESAGMDSLHGGAK